MKLLETRIQTGQCKPIPSLRSPEICKMFRYMLIWLIGFALMTPVAHSSPFSPDQIPNLKLWFDASDINGDGTNPAGGAVVNFWADKSGLNINATNSGKTGGIYVANAINNRGGVYFGNHDDNWLRTQVSSELDFVESTIFMVANDMSSVSHFAVSQDGVRDNELLFFDETMWHHFNGAGRSHSPGFTVPDNEYYIQTGLWGQGFGDMTMYLNGIETFGGSWQFGHLGEPDFSPVPRAAYLGQRAQYFNEDFDGIISEVLVYEGKLTWEQRNMVGWYLTENYGITTEYLPEPATLGLLLMGGLALLRRRRV